MIVEYPETWNLLGQIVAKLEPDASLHEDLIQEALVHLWLEEEGHPGQRPSWYFQSCNFHLRNYLRSGRSIDSSKRRYRKVSFAKNQDHLPAQAEEEEPDELWDTQDTAENLLALVSEREMLALLAGRLNSRDQVVLDYLVEGFGVREIARKLNVTHGCVVKRRHKIAALALKLGIAPLPRKPPITLKLKIVPLSK